MFRQLMASLKQNLEQLGEQSSLIKKVAIGLERECLRINTDGTLSQKPHNSALGSALTHPNITTDFAENLLEFVTDPKDSAQSVFDELNKIQAFTLENLDNELFWPNSMPPSISSNDEIPIAYFGDSNQGRMKTLYRTGLSHRYGKMMQAIAGIHFNFSLHDDFFKALQKATDNTQTLQAFKTDRYLHLVRNAYRFGFVVPYFFGASPIVCQSFLPEGKNSFEAFNDEDSYLKNGTSLRLSDIGYGNNKCEFDVSPNNIDEYIDDIANAVLTPCPKVFDIGVKVNGEYRQINDHILQIENEYYSSLRPKQVPKDDETLLKALKKRGIEYVELRSLDIMPNLATGVSVETLRFLQAFLTTCLLSDALPMCPKGIKINQQNLKRIAENGRCTDISINLVEHDYPISDALRFVIEWMRPVCNLLGSEFVDALNTHKKLIDAPMQTPSAIILSNIKKSGDTYQEYFLKKAHQFKQDYVENSPLTEEDRQQFTLAATRSLEKQKAIEAMPQIPFDDYLDNYFK